MKKRIIIIGGGASGFFCAINIAENHPNCSITIYEKTTKCLSKVKVSGGGRCNVTHNAHFGTDYLKNYPRGKNVLKKLLKSFSAQDTMKWFEERGVLVKTESDKRVFPVSDSSETIINLFISLAKKYQINIETSKNLVRLEKKEINWCLDFADGTNDKADFVVMCIGGQTKLSHYDVLNQKSEEIILPVPSLFTFNIVDSNLRALQGLSVENALVKIQKTKHEYKGSVLITHWGLSGPAVLKLSAFVARELFELDYHFFVQLNWTGIVNEELVRNELMNFIQQSPSKYFYKNPCFKIPTRLWQYLCDKAEINDSQVNSSLSKKLLNKFIETLVNDSYEVSGKTTFKEEFVTCGGVKLEWVHSETLESIKFPRLYFAGEVIDIDGITGGFNFQHAWSSAHAVANDILKKLA